MLAFSALTYQEGHLICKTHLQLPVETSGGSGLTTG